MRSNATKVYLAGGIVPEGGGGAGGLEKLPACRRANSSRFSWFAVLVVDPIASCRIAALCDARACLCIGGVADVAPIAPGAIPPGAVAEGVAGGYCSPARAGRLDSGEEGPGPPGTATFGPGAPTPGPVRCAQTGAANASAATIATPLKRYFMTLILRCSSGMAKAYPTLILR
jgi:hypothetical protein